MAEIKIEQWVLKLAILGDVAVGKTSLIDRFIQKKFEEDYKPTIGVNIVIHEVKLEDINAMVRLTLWDIAGQEKYDLSRKLYFNGCDGALLVYDITRSTTFENIKLKWLKDFKHYGKEDTVYILIGNKIDLKESQVVSTEEGKKLANEIKANDFIETSAKEGDNVNNAFERLVHQVIKKSNK